MDKFTCGAPSFGHYHAETREGFEYQKDAQAECDRLNALLEGAEQDKADVSRLREALERIREYLKSCRVADSYEVAEKALAQEVVENG